MHGTSSTIAPAPTESRPFPAAFVWGAATAAYQVEGAVAEDGRGESIWDRFTATPGKVLNGDSGRVACDSYHRHSVDVGLMRALGLDAFRFSIAWPRILPEGRGRVNPAGLDYYDRFVDELLANGIEPFLTLYHWDLPQALEDRGGWTSRETADAFAEYAEVVAARLGDRVRHWITVNEPWVIAWLGYGLGLHAPGRTSEADAVAAGHHVLLAHGRAVEVLRRDVPEAEVGITLDLIPMHALTESDADVNAAVLEDATRNRWFLDPVLRGEYPAEALVAFRRVAPGWRGGRPARHRAAARLPRHQLLPPPRRARQPGDRRARDRRARGQRVHGHGLGGLPGRAPRAARARAQRLRVRRRCT